MYASFENIVHLFSQTISICLGVYHCNALAVGEYNALTLCFRSIVIWQFVYHTGIVMKDIKKGYIHLKISSQDKSHLRITAVLYSVSVLLLMFGFGTVVLYITAVLFGAPLWDKTEETLVFALIFSALLFLPVTSYARCNHRSVTNVCLDILEGGSDDSNISCLRKECFIVILGAWCGAIPIPLDWDRPWQHWPFTCVIGLLCGYIINGLVSFLYTLMEQKPSQKRRCV